MEDKIKERKLMKKWLYKMLHTTWCLLIYKCPECKGKLIHRSIGRTCRDCGWNEYEA